MQAGRLHHDQWGPGVDSQEGGRLLPSSIFETSEKREGKLRGLSVNSQSEAIDHLGVTKEHSNVSDSQKCMGAGGAGRGSAG